MDRRSFLAVLLGSVVMAGLARETLAGPFEAAPHPITPDLDDVALEYSKKGGGGHGRGHGRGRGRGRHRGWVIGRRRRRHGWYRRRCRHFRWRRARRPMWR